MYKPTMPLLTRYSAKPVKMNIRFNALPVEGIFFLCPFCQRVIAEGNFVIDVTLIGEEHTPCSIKVIITSAHKAECCEKGKQLPMPLVLENKEQVKSEIQKIEEKIGKENFSLGKVSMVLKRIPKGKFSYQQ